MSTLIDKFPQKLKLEPWESIQCEAILKDVVLLPCTNSLSFGILYLKNLDSRARLLKNLPGSQKFTSNQYIQQQLKRSLKPPESISAFRSIVGNTKRVLSVNVLVLHKLCSQKFFTRIHISTNSPVVVWPTKVNMLCVIRASSQTQFNWKEC